MLLYVSGPYSADTADGIDANIAAARKVAIELWYAGHAVICPHLNTIHMEQDTELTHADYLRGDLLLLARCDGICMVHGWERSKGATIEREFAEEHSIHVYVPGDLPSLHPTEVRCPKATEAFMHIVMHMYRVMLSKNSDYSPANILATGEVGLVTRLWDKIARLMNLTGFRVDIASSSFEKPREPKNESIDDTLLDAANYSVIGLLLRQGVWGR